MDIENRGSHVGHTRGEYNEVASFSGRVPVPFSSLSSVGYSPRMTFILHLDGRAVLLTYRTEYRSLQYEGQIQCGVRHNMIF